MWEQIRSNKRKSVVLVVIMAVLLVVLGYFVAEAYIPGGGIFGVLVAVAIWLLMSLVSYYAGGRILLMASGAKPIEKSDHPRLVNVVEEMKIASGLAHMPDIYIINDEALNAFAAGRDAEHASVAITAGLLRRLNRDQLQGVIAHEVSHINNRDVLLMSMVGVMVGAIAIVSETFLRSLWYSGGSRRRYSGGGRKGGGQGAAIMMIVALVLAILAPILAQVIYFTISRKREYLADACAAVYTRYPEGLASALEILASDTAVLRSAKKSTAPMYIVNPLHKEGSRALNLSATHPPITERVEILRKIGGNVSYSAYNAAMKASGAKAKVPGSALRSGEAYAVREAHPEAAEADAGRKTQMRQVGDLLRKANQFVFLTCVCGLRVKLPPDFKEDHVDCPRCGNDLRVPVAAMAASGQVAEMLTPQETGGRGKTPPRRRKPSQPLEVTRKGNEWMSFKCACGATKTLSPQVSAPFTECAKCGRTIKINYVA